MKRASGILLPVFSLPGPYGIGSLGKEARAFAEFLQAAGQKWWQVLPVGPADGRNSPYASPSTFAGNPLLIDLDTLGEAGLLTEGELRRARVKSGSLIRYEPLKKTRESLLRKAFSRMGAADRQAAEAFSNARSWVGEYALYCAAKARFGGAPWYEWPDRALRRHEPHALARWREELREEVAFHTCLQFWFFTQWESLKRYVNGLGIQIMGDLPIYVSLDSADVWAEREQFLLDEEGRPERVAGVPPDYFSAEGQLWGNPLYNWDFMEEDGFGWWIRRVDGAIHLFDAVRIDHFRGLESFWSVPADAETARTGRWEQGPGMKLLRVLNEWFRDAGAPFVAEDLGLLTEDVHRLREAAGLPGMKVLEFAFTGPDNAYLPHHYDPRCICYTGTHDNNTLAGWCAEAEQEERDFAERYLGVREDPEALRRAVLRCGQGSVAALFIAQMQDYLGLGAEARINVPGVADGNWRWRMLPKQATPALAAEIRQLTADFGRCAP